MMNRAKEMLRKGKTAVGAWMSIMHPESVRTVADAGFDWVLFDIEHGAGYELETVDSMIQAMNGTNAIPLIRVVWNDINAIKRALDTGAYGVVVPWVSSKEEAVNAVRFCKYPPEGLRGVAPGRAARAWRISSDEYLATANEEIMVIIQIEREEAVNNIEEILSVDGVDATFIGPMDLSASMGLLGKPFAPEVVLAMDKVLNACKKAGIAPGIAFGSGIDHINELIARGFRFVGVGGDTSFLLRGCREALKQIKR